MGPFPLQGNLRRLKPNIGKGISGLAVALIFFFEQLRSHLKEWLGQPEAIIALTILSLVILFIAAELYLRQIYFNESGLGIAMKFGGSNTWYSWLELRELKLHRRTPMMGRPRRSRIVLNFHTGSVRIRTGLYDPKGIEELTAILGNYASRMASGPDAMLGMPSARRSGNQDYSPQKASKQSYAPPSYPKGPPQQDPGYRDLSKSKTPSLKKQLEMWNPKQGRKSK